MFIADRLVFLELHKTGCSHIRRVLNHVLDGRLVGEHNQATPDLFTDRRIFVGSVRDPWEWYVSLWSFGCDGRGGLRDRLTGASGRLRGMGWRNAPGRALIAFLSRADNREAWLSTYRSSDDPAAFRDWLQMLHSEAYMSDIGEGYCTSALRHAAGLMTFRYLKLFSTRAGEERRLHDLTTLPLIEAWDAERNFIDTFIRNESLESDLIRVLEDQGVAMDQDSRSNILTHSKTNASSRKKFTSEYYDTETARLVAEREKLIIDKFGYTMPAL